MLLVLVGRPSKTAATRPSLQIYCCGSWRFYRPSDQKPWIKGHPQACVCLIKMDVRTIKDRVLWAKSVRLPFVMDQHRIARLGQLASAAHCVEVHEPGRRFHDGIYGVAFCVAFFCSGSKNNCSRCCCCCCYRRRRGNPRPARLHCIWCLR